MVTRRRGGSSMGSLWVCSSISSSSFSRKSVVTPNRRLICTTLSISGMDWAPSHLETDWRLTFSRAANSSSDQQAFFRSVMILSAKIIMGSS